MMGDGSAFTRTDVFQMAIRVAFVSAVTYFSIKWLVNQIDPTSKSRKKAEERAREQLRKVTSRAGLDGKQSLQLDKLSDHEMIIASQLVVPDEISVSWKDIAGLDHLIQELRETVILPIQKRELFADSRLTQPPKGVLLHGPPGCGKTLIAKATAKEANMSFINLDVSLLTDKWYGETQKLAAAVFSLAVKLQPCIVFIDEIESFLRTRTAHDHEATAMMKTQFMSLWDGLITDSSCTVIIMGATNRPQDLDKAIQRRMPATFHVPMPSEAQREHILQLIMKPEPTASDIDYKRLAVSTEGFSGSDLHELCRQAAVYRVRDMAREEIARERTLPTNRPAGDSEDEFVDAIRPITMDDMRHSLSKLKESKIQCGSLAPSMRTLLDALSWDQFQSVGKRDCIYRTVIRALANVEYSSPNNEQNSRHIEQNSRNLPNAYLEPNSRNPTRESPNSQNVISKYAEHNSKPTSEYPNKNHVEKFYQPTGSNVIANGKCVETYHASEGKSTDKYAEILNSDKSTYDLKYAEESFRTSNNNCSDKNAEKSNQKANPSGTSEKGRIEMNVPSQERYACGGKYAKAPYHATEEYHSELHVQSHHNSNYQRHITTNIDTRPSRISEESSSNNADDSYHTSEENFFEKDKSHVKSKKSISSRVQIADDPKYSVSKEKYATSCEDLNQNPSFKNQQSELPEFLTKEDEILTGNLSSDRKFKGDSNPFFVSNISEINFVIKKPTSFMELDKESDDVAESEQQKEPKN